MNAALQSKATAPSTLSREALRRRLRDLAGDERQVQADFLLHLAEFDERKGFAEAGYDSLWTYCLGELHLREGPAARRIGAMRVLRQHPALEAPLRDGRLCLSTVTLIAPLLAEMALEEVVSRAAYKTKLEVEQLVVSLRPRPAPCDGVRLVLPRPAPAVAQPAAPSVAPGSTDGALFVGVRGGLLVPETAPKDSGALADAAGGAGTSQACDTSSSADAGAQPAREPRRADLRPVSAEQWSLRVTMDAAMKEDLETLKYLLSHKAGGDLSAVVREALRCAVEKHGKRRGLIPPTRARRRPRAAGSAAGTSAPSDTAALATAAARAESSDRAMPTAHAAPSGAAGGALPACVRGPAPRPRPPIPSEVRRAVWKRDGNCCAFVSADGQRCGSRWKLELDHVRPVSLGGPSTIDNVRVACRTHNLLYAERALGREFMAKAVAAGGRGAERGRRNEVAPSRREPREPFPESVKGSG